MYSNVIPDGCTLIELVISFHVGAKRRGRGFALSPTTTTTSTCKVTLSLWLLLIWARLPSRVSRDADPELLQKWWVWVAFVELKQTVNLLGEFSRGNTRQAFLYVYAGGNTYNVEKCRKDRRTAHSRKQSTAAHCLKQFTEAHS